MKNGQQGGLVGGEGGGGRRKAEICSFRCLPTTRVQLRQLCFRMKLSAHAKKRLSCGVPSSPCFRLSSSFFGQSKEMSPNWKDAHTERELLQNRLKIFQRDGKLENEEGFAHRSHMEMQG